MATTVLGLKNDYGDLETLPADEVVDLANWVEYLAAGHQALNLAGTGTYTASTVEGSASVLNLTGVLTGARTLVVPTWAGKRWLIYNNTSGAFVLTVKTSAGTGVTVRQGCAAVLWCNGTNVLRATPELEQDGDLSPLQIVDANGNEQLKFTATASAVNEATLTNAAAGNSPQLAATGGDTNIDLDLRGKGTGGLKLATSGQKVGFFGVTTVVRAAALTQTYSTADRTLGAYTADVESAAYTGAADGEAKLADLNALRVAVENLRAFVEDLAQHHNAVVDDLQAYGLEQ